MEYKFLNDNLNTENIVLPESDKINTFLLKSNSAEIIKALNFLESDDKFLYIYGFLGTGKRQFINYFTDFADADVIKLEYYCKPSTVCDDILLNFIDTIEKSSLAKVVVKNAKITTLAVKFQQYILAIKKPFLIVLHSYDDIQQNNLKLIEQCFEKTLSNSNIKLIISTRGMVQDILAGAKVNRKIFLKGFSKELFREFVESSGIKADEKTVEEFFKLTRGYYYYTALSIKIVKAMELKLPEFIEKVKLSEMSFDEYLGTTYINIIPTAIRNFFWFLKTIRHGLTLNALAVYDLYDDFSINYLKTNLMVFQTNETIYIQDYFQQDIDIVIPLNIKKKLHKYIISIYEKELKEPLQTRSILMSRQSMRAEIEYHNNCIKNGEESLKPIESVAIADNSEPKEKVKEVSESITEKLKEAAKLADENKYTDAIEKYQNILDTEQLDSHSVADIRILIARLYKSVEDYSKAQHYYELVGMYYKRNNEIINLNYLYYELTDIYFLMYKNERAIDTAKKVIYSVDTPQSLMVQACTLLGNIYSSLNNSEDAYRYYKKALESIDKEAPESTLAELYFKYALVNDDRDDTKTAYEYYIKCISLALNENPYKALAYSNLGSCYFENNNLEDAKDCFKKAYDIEKSTNNYDGIYYTSMKLANILMQENSDAALDYLKDAKQSAEFLNEEYYIVESSIAIGDFYYNMADMHAEALKEYYNARKHAQFIDNSIDITKIESRIKDMKYRLDAETFNTIEKKYG